MRQNQFLKDIDGYISYSISECIGSNQIVIFCHWLWSDKRGKTFDILSEWLLNHNVSAIKFDFYWHWESSGSIAMHSPYDALNALVKIYEFVKKKWYSKVGIVGTSYGGLIASRFASEYSIDFLVLKSPLSNYLQKELVLNGRDYIDNRKYKGFSLKNFWQEVLLHYKFLQDISHENFIAYNFWSKISCPVCIIHWWVDQFVPLQQSIDFSTTLSDSRLLILQKANHFYSDSKHFEALIAYIQCFISGFLK